MRLPEPQQNELRDYWDDRLLDGPRDQQRQRDRARRLALEAAVVLCVPLFLVNALLAGPVATLLLLVVGALVGAGVGLIVHAIRGIDPVLDESGERPARVYRADDLGLPAAPAPRVRKPSAHAALAGV